MRTHLDLTLVILVIFQFPEWSCAIVLTVNYRSPVAFFGANEKLFRVHCTAEALFFSLR